tara:strand:- start:1027 stop:1386 length:360 start_codon:yes stop_codon:yes gene_type:complete
VAITNNLVAVIPTQVRQRPQDVYESPLSTVVGQQTAMYKAWCDHTKATFKALKKLTINTEDDHKWMVKSSDKRVAANLLLDLIHMTKFVPFHGIEINMTSLIKFSLEVDPKNRYLAGFF